MRPTGPRSPGPGGLDSERTRPAGEIEHRRADQQEDEAPPEVHIDSQDARALDRARGDQDHAVKREQQSERQPKVSHFFHFVAGPHPRDLCLRGLRRSALLRRYRTFHQNRRFSATVSTETTRPSAAGRLYHTSRSSAIRGVRLYTSPDNSPDGRARVITLTAMVTMKHDVQAQMAPQKFCAMSDG